MKKFALIFAAVFCLTFILALGPAVMENPDGAGAWTSIGPSGGDIRGLARNSKSPAEMYAVSSSVPSQVFRSVTSGKTWTLEATVDDFIIDLAIDPINANTIYLLGNSTYYHKSSDAGKTYTKLPFPALFETYYGRIAIHPTNPNIIVIAGSYNSGSSLAFIKTEDGGANWTVRTLPLAGRYQHGRDVVFAPSNPNYLYYCGELYAGSADKAAVFVSKNGGSSWTNVTDNAVFNDSGWGCAYAIHVDPKNAKGAWVGHSNGIARTMNGGLTWVSQQTDGLTQIVALAGDRSSPSVLYAAGAGAKGIYSCLKSSDGGKTWKAYTSGFYGEGRRLLADGSRAYISTETGIYQSLNGGVSWKPSHSGIRGANIQAMAVAPSSPSALYAGIPGFPLIKTANTGGAWTICGKFEGNTLVANVAIHPSSPQTILVKPSG